MSSLLRTTRGASSLLRSRIIPTIARPAASILPIRQCRNQGSVSAAPPHAVSAPMLADIEKRWDFMPPQEQAELWMALRDRMKGSWSELTLQEKKASYWIAFGPHGPRTLPHPDQNKIVFWGVMKILAISTVLFAIIRALGKSKPRTMTKEWQEMSNEYMKAQKIEPITGVSSAGYKGPGMIQSK